MTLFLCVYLSISLCLSVPGPSLAHLQPGRPPFQGQQPFPGMPVPSPGLGPIPVPGMGGWGGRSGGLVPDFDGDLQVRPLHPSSSVNTAFKN